MPDDGSATTSALADAVDGAINHDAVEDGEGAAQHLVEDEANDDALVDDVEVVLVLQQNVDGSEGTREDRGREGASGRLRDRRRHPRLRLRPHEQAGRDCRLDPLAHDFQIQAPTQEVELVAELRATGGKVTFERSSMRLVRIGG